MMKKNPPGSPWKRNSSQEVIEPGKPVLDICHGAQLIASAMGGEVFPNPRKGDWMVPHPARGSKFECLILFFGNNQGSPLAQ